MSALTGDQQRDLLRLRKKDPSTSIEAFELDGAVLVRHTPAEERSRRRSGSNEVVEKPRGAVRTFLYRLHPVGRDPKDMRCGSGWGACDECGRRLLDGDETLLLPVALDGELASNDRARVFSATINPKRTASWRPVSQPRVTEVNQVVTVDTEAESDSASVAEEPDALGSTYRRPQEKPDAVHRDPFAFDPNELDRATGRHIETQNLLARDVRISSRLTDDSACRSFFSEFGERPGVRPSPHRSAPAGETCLAWAIAF